MTTYTVEESDVLPEDTIFTVTLEELGEIERQKRDKPDEKFQKLKWKFRVESPDKFVGKTVYAETSPKLTVDDHNPFRRYAVALLAREIPLGMPIDTDDLVGLRCKLSVKHDPKTDGQGVWVRVDEVMPAGDSDEPPF